MNQTKENRREFLKRASLLAAVPFIINCKRVTADESTDLLTLIKQNARPAGTEGMGAIDAPANVSSKTILCNETDKAEKMVISGTIFQPDGKTSASNTLIYLYHTDIEGYYGRKIGEHKHGRYRGWMLTDNLGRYSFQTIKPAPYPENRFAAHIHMTVTTEKMREDWIDSILFEGDKLISAQDRNEAGKKGGFNPILKLEKKADGLWHGRRDIKLWNV